MKTLTLKSIDVIKFALFSAIFFFLTSLIVAIFLLLGLSTFIPRGQLPGLGVAMGNFSVIILPIVYAIFGFIGGLIGGALINLVLSIIGGLPINFKE